MGWGGVYVLLFSDDTIFLTENELFDETFLTFIFFLLIIGYPLSGEKFWVKDDLVWLGFSLNIPEKMWDFRSETKIRSGKLQILKGISEPSQNQARSVAGSLQWVSQMWLRPFFGKPLRIFRK